MRAEAELHARRSSPVHDWDGRCKLASLGLVAAVLATVNTPAAAACGAAFAIGLLAVARLPWRLVLGRLGAAQALLLPCLVVLPFTAGGDTWPLGPLRLSLDGLRTAALFYWRALAILTLGLAVVYATPMVVLLHTLQRFRMPRAFVVVALLAYRYLFTLWWELTRVRWALATRGFQPRATLRSHRTLANVIGVSLVRSLERTERIHFALQCRGFEGRLRTMQRFHAGRADWLKAVGCAGAAALLLMLDLKWEGPP